MGEIMTTEFVDIFDCQQCRELNGLCRVHINVQKGMVKEIEETGYDPICLYCMRRTWHNDKQELPCPRHGGPLIVESPDAPPRPKKESSYNFPIGVATRDWKRCEDCGKRLFEGRRHRCASAQKEPTPEPEPKPEIPPPNPPSISVSPDYQDKELQDIAQVLLILKKYESDEKALARMLGYLADRLG